MAESRGVLIVKANDTSIFVDFYLTGAAGTKITTGTAMLYALEVQPTDGTFKTLDWNDHTFKAGALTTPTATLVHQTYANGARNSGIWTYRITGSDLAAFTVGNKYRFIAVHSSLVEDAVAQVQYGGGEGDDTPQTGDSYARLGAPAGATISADIAGVPAAVFAAAIESGLSFLQAQRLIAAFAAGVSSGMTPTGGAPVFKGAGVSDTRISGTLDASGNRTAVVLSP